MHLDLTRLTPQETLVDVEVRLPDDPSQAPGSLAAEGVTFPEPLRLTGAARREGAIAHVSGHLVGRIEIACSRCLEAIDREVDLTFEARYADAEAAPTADASAVVQGPGGGEEGIQLAPEDLDVSFLPAGATRLDLAEVAREQVLLDLPFRATCRADCAGLCASCGANRNTGACSCEDDPAHGVDPRLAPLADFRRRLKGS